MNVAELFALIGFNFDDDADRELDSKLDSTADSLASWADKSALFMGQAFAAFFLNDLYNMAVEGIGRVAALLDPREVFGRVEDQAGALDDIAKQARAIGLTTEALQQYRFVAGQTGVDQAKFEQAFVRVNKTVGEAARGTQQYQKTIRDLGLEEQKLAALSSEDRFDTIIQSLAGITDESKRTALGIRLLGDRTFPKFATLLQGGREGLAQLKAQAEDLGFVVSDEDARKAEAFNDALDRTTRAAGALKNRALNPLFEPLTRLLKALEDFVVQNRELLAVPFEAFATFFVGFFNAATEAVLFVGSAVRAVTPFLTELWERLGGVEGILKLATIATISFGVAWAWVNRTRVIAFLQTLAVELAVAVVRLVLAAESALLFLKNLTLASAWSAIKAGFTRLIALLSTVQAQFVILALFVGFVLLLLEDIYVLFDGGESAIGKFFGIDPNSQSDLEQYYDVLLLIGIALGAILFLLAGIPGLIAILVLMVVYLAAQWDKVVEAFENMWDEVSTFFKQLGMLILWWAEDAYNDVVKVFEDIIQVVKDAIQDAFSELEDIPAKARSLLSKLPGASALGLDGADVVGRLVGGGSTNPNVDRAGRVFQARNNRAVNIDPTIEVQVNATDRTANDAADIFRGSVFDELFRDIEAAYEGEEI